MPPKKTGAQWSTKPSQIKGALRAGSTTFEGEMPLYDNNVLQGRIKFEMSEDRVLTMVWEQEPGVQGLADFRAWSKEVNNG